MPRLKGLSLFNPFLLIPQNPPALTCQSQTDWPTSDLWPLNGILIVSPAACGLLIHCLSLPQSHTQTSHTLTHLLLCVWVCDRSLKDFFCLFFFFGLFILFFLALLCTAWTIQVIVTKSSRKDFKEITIIFTSCLPNAKRVLQSSSYQSHNDTIFVFKWGKKYIYI